MSTEEEREEEELAIRMARTQRPDEGSVSQQRIRELMHERTAQRQQSSEEEGPVTEEETSDPDVGD